MNEKDLFYAINNIEEKYISQAGKYLIEIGDNSSYGETIEVREGGRKFSPIKIAVSIAAAAAVVFGASTVLKLHNMKKMNGVASSTANDAINMTSAATSASSTVGSSPKSGNEPNNAYMTTAPENANNEIDTIGESTGTESAYQFIGPDRLALPTGRITVVSDEIDDDYTLSSVVGEGFVYVRAGISENYNSVDTPEIFDDWVSSQVSSNDGCVCIYKGETLGDLTVIEATCKINYPNNNYETGIYEYGYAAFEGEVTTDVYIVKDYGGEYYCVFRNREFQIPSMNIPPNFTTAKYTIQDKTIGDFVYATELPALKLDDSSVDGLEKYYWEDIRYRKATVKLSNISMRYFAGTVELNADVSELFIQDFDEQPSDLSKIDINNFVYIEELEKLFYEIRVYRDKHGYINQTPEAAEGELVPGMIVEAINEDGNVIFIQTYKGN